VEGEIVSKASVIVVVPSTPLVEEETIVTARTRTMKVRMEVQTTAIAPVTGARIATIRKGG
jgi:hypothetical protein